MKGNGVGGALGPTLRGGNVMMGVSTDPPLVPSAGAAAGTGAGVVGAAADPPLVPARPTGGVSNWILLRRGLPKSYWLAPATSMGRTKRRGSS